MDNNEINARVSMLAMGRRLSDAALRYCSGPFGSPYWQQQLGVAILRRWQGTKYPVPFVSQAVGFKRRPATDVTAFAGATYSNSTIYYHGVELVSGSGIVTQARHEQARVAVWGTSGYVGLIPNTPVQVRVRQVTGPRALVSWQYNPVSEQATPGTFEVFGDAGTGTMDWSTVVATVTYLPGVTSYAWRSGVLAAGARLYNVRAKTAGGIYSLVPLVGDLHIGSLGDYAPVGGAVGLGVQIRTAVPSAPPAPTVE